MALNSLGANKMRSGLTMLGIIIGTGAVIALLSVGQGAQAAITDQVRSIGANLIFVFPGQLQQGGGQATLRNFVPLTRQDAEALADPARAPHVLAVAPEINRNVTITYRGEQLDVPLVGTTPEYEYVRNFPVEYGEFITVGDETTEARVAVLGSRTAGNLAEDPEILLGDTIRLNNIPFRVIGILEEKGGQGVGGRSSDNLVIIPLSTAQRRLFSGRFVTANGLRVDLINISAIDEDTFTVASQQDVLGVLSQITGVLTIFLGAIAGISLLVGGIGIMNIMLVSVTERTREIGIRKAVGARRGDILSQFLVESVVLSILGGLVGIGFGWAVSAGVNTLGAFNTVVSTQAVALAVSFSLAVGLFFGIYPASRAANLHPIQALRYE
jgi:putative ABC transport system permease protein